MCFIFVYLFDVFLGHVKNYVSVFGIEVTNVNMESALHSSELDRLLIYRDCEACASEKSDDEEDMVGFCPILQLLVSLPNPWPSVSLQLQLIFTAGCYVHIINSICNGMKLIV